MGTETCPGFVRAVGLLVLLLGPEAEPGQSVILMLQVFLSTVITRLCDSL